MRIAAVSMVKNECDVIELFIRINSRFFDEIFILDHHSTDGTAAIVASLAQSGFKVHCSPVADGEFNQSRVISGVVRELAASGRFDYIMPLDADEFLCGPAADEIRSALPDFLARDGAGLVPWRTYCPVNADYFEASAPLFDNFVARAHEPNPYHKVIVGSDFARDCEIAEGNHSAARPSRRTEAVVLPLVLAHAPVRSPEQIMTKALLGSHALAMKKGRRPGEGFHWDRMANAVRNANYELTDEDLLVMALMYATDDESVDVGLDEGAPRIGLPDDCIVLQDLARISILRSFDLELARLVRQLRG